MSKCLHTFILILVTAGLPGCSWIYENRSNFIDKIHVASRPADDEGCVVVAGDSWAFFDMLYSSSNEALKDANVGCRAVYTYPTVPSAANAPPRRDRGASDPTMEFWLAWPGTRAEQWERSAHTDWIGKALAQYPRAKVVFLYVGGNDVLNYFKEPDRDIVGDVMATVDSIQASARGLAKRPVNIVIVGYTRSNFVDSLPGKSTQFMRNYQDLLKAMGNPSQAQINTRFNALAEGISARVKADPYQSTVLFVNNMCLYAGDSPCDKALTETMDPDALAGFHFRVLWMNSQWVDAIHLGIDAEHLVARRAVCAAIERGWLSGSCQGMKVAGN
jgi:hypothetical protein